MELLRLNGEGIQIGVIEAEELDHMVGHSALFVRLADGRDVVIAGLTRDECKKCLPAFLATARLTVSSA